MRLRIGFGLRHGTTSAVRDRPRGQPRSHLKHPAPGRYFALPYPHARPSDTYLTYC